MPADLDLQCFQNIIIPGSTVQGLRCWPFAAKKVVTNGISVNGHVKKSIEKEGETHCLLREERTRDIPPAKRVRQHDRLVSACQPILSFLES